MPEPARSVGAVHLRRTVNSSAECTVGLVGPTIVYPVNSRPAWIACGLPCFIPDPPRLRGQVFSGGVRPDEAIGLQLVDRVRERLICRRGQTVIRAVPPDFPDRAVIFTDLPNLVHIVCPIIGYRHLQNIRAVQIGARQVNSGLESIGAAGIRELLYYIALSTHIGA